MKLMKDKAARGQALVVIGLAMVGLLAMAAMAVDGSMVYSDRRQLQSAADNAVMSAAAVAATTMDAGAMNYQTFGCAKSAVIQAEQDAINAAISRAGTYGYTIDTDISDNNGVQIACRIIVNAGLVERYLEVRVKIAHNSNTAFTRFIMPTGVGNTVEAAARVDPRRSLSMGNAIASLAPSCPGVEIGGNNTVNVSGGGIFSNSCMSFSGSTDITVNVDYGGIGYMTTYTENGHVNLMPAGVTPQQSTEPLPTVVIPTPDCLSLPNYGSYSGSGTINPGRYSSINLSGHDVLIMNPGLYCLYGDFQTNGGQTITMSPSATAAQGVTIYMASGNLTFNGNSLIQLRAPSDDFPPAIKGMMIYMPPNNAGSITLTGTSGSFFQGTVYAPRGSIDAGGTVDIPFASELVGYSVNVHGNARIDVTDNAAVNYTRPPLIELVK